MAYREGRSPVAIYHAHRWFARRFSSAFRAILVAANTGADEDFWDAYYNGVDLEGMTVLDPFVGGGTSVVEAARMGASPIGVDVDPVACAISSFELRAHQVCDLEVGLKKLQQRLIKKTSRYYETIDQEGNERRILHAFWVQLVECSGCGEKVEAHPHYQLAFDAPTETQWCFCSECHHVAEFPLKQKSFRCKECEAWVRIGSGTVVRGKLNCPYCDESENLIDVAERTGECPQWQLFALETIPTGEGRSRYLMSERKFQRATDEDRERISKAHRALSQRKRNSGWKGIPTRSIPKRDRSDNRLVKYGYRKYDELFNSRQLLHLSYLAEEIKSLDKPAHDALALAFSDHLATNCMMTYYAFGWRRLAPLFSIRAYRHVSRPVEINPWIDGTGRGTFPHAVRQVQRAIDFANAPTVAHLEGGFIESGSLKDRPKQKRRIINGNTSDLKQLKDHSVDFILTDPPYFDNIAYSELADFYLPWMQMFGLAPKSKSVNLPDNLSAISRGPSGFEVFKEGLANCFCEMRRVLRDGGRLVFSFQHKTPRGWESLAYALAKGGWQPIQVFPMLGNSSAGPHRQEGTIAWDAVVVCRKGRVRDAVASIGSEAIVAAREHCDQFVDLLDDVEHAAYRDPDRVNLFRASLVAASLGMFSVDGRIGRRPLKESLESADKEWDTNAASK